MFKRSSSSVPSTPLPAPPSSSSAASSSSSSAAVPTSGSNGAPAGTSPLIPYDASYQNENEKAGLLLKRIVVWEKVIEAVVPWVKQMQKIEASSAKSYAKLSSLLQFQDDVNAASGDLVKGLDSLRDFSTGVMGYHEQFSKYLKEQTLPKLDSLNSEVKKQGKQLTKKIEKASGSLKKSEEEAVTAILNHQKICEEMKTTPNLTAVDPWLTEYRVKGKLNVLAEQQNSYKKKMLDITEKIVGIDETLARTIQDAFLQLAKWRSKQLVTLKTDIDDLASAMSRIMPEADFQQYSNKTGLAKHIAHWKQPSGATNIDYPFRGSDLTKIVRSGVLQRQGKVMKSRWHAAQCLLTQSAFLHCFDNYEEAQKETENPFFSIDLRQCTIQLTSDEQAAANCFEISSGKDRWFLKAQNEEMMVDWMIAMRKVKDDMLKKTNPPFPAEIVQQYSPRASTAPPLPTRKEAVTPEPPIPASPVVNKEEEEDISAYTASEAEPSQGDSTAAYDQYYQDYNAGDGSAYQDYSNYDMAGYADGSTQDGNPFGSPQ